MSKPVAWVDEDVLLMAKPDGFTFTANSDNPADDDTTWIPLYTHPVKELTDEEIHQAIRRGFARDGFLSDGIFLEIKELLRKAQEK